MAQNQRVATVACKEFEEDLVLFYYGDLTEDERSPIERHVQSCPSCASYLKELGTLLPRTIQPDEPPQRFWDDYSRELRHKLSVLDEHKSWREWLSAFFRPWAIPITATAAVIGLAFALVTGTGVWPGKDFPVEEAVVEVLPITEDLDFFATMEVLDTMDLLEYFSATANGAA